MKRVELNVTGMTCKDCTSKVKKALQAINGVIDVGVSFEKAMAWLNASSGLIAYMRYCFPNTPPDRNGPVF